MAGFGIIKMMEIKVTEMNELIKSAEMKTT